MTPQARILDSALPAAVLFAVEFLHGLGLFLCCTYGLRCSSLFALTSFISRIATMKLNPTKGTMVTIGI